MRITGGVYRSRALRAPRGTATRPTSDRVREALFSMLTARSVVAGARVLDLYAGTGALALEALSRGAVQATLVESGREALDAIRSNVEALGAAKTTRILGMPVERAIRQLQGKEAPFDLVFADPPYADVPGGAAVRALVSLVQADLVALDGTVILEHASVDAPPAMEGLALVESRRHGDTRLSFYEKSGVHC